LMSHFQANFSRAFEPLCSKTSLCCLKPPQPFHPFASTNKTGPRRSRWDRSEGSSGGRPRIIEGPTPAPQS
jgi:hypothetical protein